jgi:hypothetical protein
MPYSQVIENRRIGGFWRGSEDGNLDYVGAAGGAGASNWGRGALAIAGYSSAHCAVS